jgi:hypothetical protein
MEKLEDNRVKEWFRDHIVTNYDENEKTGLIRITWKKPGSGTYAIVYIIDTHTARLSVVGDLGEAIYGWSGSISLNFIAGCDLHYFNSKCLASSCGERGKTWNDEFASASIKSIFQEEVSLRNDDYQEIYEYGCLQEVFKANYPELLKVWNEEISWKDLPKENKAQISKIIDEFVDNEQNLNRLPDYISKRFKSLEQKRSLISEAINSCGTEDEWSFWLQENGNDLFGQDYWEYFNIGKTVSIRVRSHLIGIKMACDYLNAQNEKESESVHVYATNDPENLFVSIGNWFLSLIGLGKKKTQKS